MTAPIRMGQIVHIVSDPDAPVYPLHRVHAELYPFDKVRLIEDAKAHARQRVKRRERRLNTRLALIVAAIALVMVAASFAADADLARAFMGGVEQ